MAEILNITVPNEMMEALRSRVREGTYASAEEAVLAAIAGLVNADDAKDERLDVIRAAILASLNDPSPSLSGSDVRRRLDDLYARHRG
jgi:antitoxin ParD1/3/4